MKILLALVLASSAFAVGAADVLDCRGAYAEQDISECSAIERDVAQKRMQQYLEASKARFADNDLIVGSIVNAQQHWEAYRKNHCDAVFDIWTGSMRESKAIDCETKVTQVRTHQLWRWYIAANASEPTLPEPGVD